VFAGEVVAPVLVEVAVADHCAQGEDGLGALEPPAGSGDVGPVADQVAAGSLDHSGRDGPARGQGLVVTQELLIASQVADARAGAGPLGGGALLVRGRARGGQRRCGAVTGKRQVGQAVMSAAGDIASFCAARVPVPCTASTLLVISADANST